MLRPSEGNEQTKPTVASVVPAADEVKDGRLGPFEVLPIGVGAAPTAIKSNLARASTYVKSQAGLNLTTFRGRRR